MTSNIEGTHATTQLPTGLLSELSALIASRTGLHFPEEKWSDLQSGILSAAREFGFADAHSCIKWLLSTPLSKSRIEILASHLTVGETYFFRDKKSFEALENQVLPELARCGRDSLRIWCAGCATGEEPYSIAMMLDASVTGRQRPNATILATDFNPRSLHKARTGVYSEWSFRDTPAWVRERYFTKKGRSFELAPRIRNRVTFAYHNLVEDPYPSLLNNTNAMDIIFCRNVLMYFSPERAHDVVNNFHRCLVDNGWLIVNPVEASPVLLSRFRAVNFEGATLHTKKLQREKDRITVKNGCPAHDEIKAASYQVTERVYTPPAVPLPEKREEPVQGVGKRKAPAVRPYEEALALYEQGRYAEAAAKITAHISPEQRDGKTLVLLTRIFANQGKLSEAQEWCEKAISADRMNPGSYYLLATICQEQGHAEEAVKSLKRALYLDQNFVLAHFALGNLTQQQGRTRESRKHYENAGLLLKPYGPDNILSESEGMSAGRLMEIIRTMLGADIG